MTDFLVAFSGLVVIKILLKYSDKKENGSLIVLSPWCMCYYGDEF